MTQRENKWKDDLFDDVESPRTTGGPDGKAKQHNEDVLTRSGGEGTPQLRLFGLGILCLLGSVTSGCTALSDFL